MKISSRQYATSLYELVVGKTETEARAVVKNFAVLLERHRVLPKLSEIITSFQEVWDERQGELAVAVSSARKLEPATRDLILTYLQRQTGANQINIQDKIEPELIGGFVLHYNSRVVDGSLRHDLESLKNKISN